MSPACKGCGAKLQSEQQDAVGYIDPKHLGRGLCQRCFKIKQYSEVHTVPIDNEKLIQMIEAYDKKRDLLTLVVDLSDIGQTALLELAQTFSGRKLVVVVNKIDIILRDMRHYEMWERHVKALFQGQDIVVDQFFFVSAKAQLGIKRLIDYYETTDYDAIRVIGCANVGKSSLITALLNETGDEPVVLPTIFMSPGTTLEQLRVPWGRKDLYDTPGIMKPTQLSYYLSPKGIKTIALTKAIRPKHYHIYEPQTFFIGGYAQVNVYPAQTNTVSFFVSDTVPIHRKGLVTDNTFYEKHVGALLSPPNKDDLAYNETLLIRAEHRFDLTKGKRDIVISGLGWVAFAKGSTSVQVSVPKELAVYEQAGLV